MPLLSLEQKLEKKVISRFLKAVYDFNLIEDGDCLLVGLSGGKDSLCLLDLLSRRMRISKPAFRVEALHIRMENIKYAAFPGKLPTDMNTTGLNSTRNTASI